MDELGPRVHLNVHVAVAISVVSVLHRGLMVAEVTRMASAPLARIFKDSLVESLHSAGAITDSDVARMLREEAAARASQQVPL